MKYIENSKKYWIERYKNNKNSGSGSYGQLCDFKNKIINDFVKNNNIQKVIELGCGDGNQLINSKYPEYFGYDISPEIVKKCRKIFANKKNYHFNLVDNDRDNKIEKGDLMLSLDVIFHLVEDDVYFKYIEELFNNSTRFVIIYSSSGNAKFARPHCRDRKFTDDILKKFTDWTLIKKINNPYTNEKYGWKNGSFSDFYIYEKKK